MVLLSYWCIGSILLTGLIEGLNGRLPNQDMMNSFTLISGWGRVPVTLYDTTTNSEPFPMLQRFLPESIRSKPQVQEYLRRARNILRHASYQSLGKASGVHGLFHQYVAGLREGMLSNRFVRYRIDAFTMYAIPDVGPHGFHTFGGYSTDFPSFSRL
jgi:glycosylphosphatidylinositol transamidase